MQDLIIKSTAFENGGMIPNKYTGYGEDISPSLTIKNLSEETKSIAIIMDDLDFPLKKDGLNHWLIWNIPKTNTIKENIPYGCIVKELNGAMQGIGYGKNRYAGPKIPFFLKNTHRYVFTVYALDIMLNLAYSAKKKDLIKAIDGHIIQSGNIMGICKNK